MLMVDGAQVGDALLRAVPFARTLKLAFDEVAVDDAGGFRAVARMPDADELHNHVGGPHAGAIFTLGETASGAVVLAAFGHLLDRVVPLAVRAEITYQRRAMGEVRAVAHLGGSAGRSAAELVAEVAAELAAGHRPEFPVPVEIGTTDGVTTRMTVIWTLRPIGTHSAPRAEDRRTD